MFDKLKSTAGSVADRATGLKDAGIGALRATVDELNVTLPHLAEVGYSVTRVQIEIGLAPKVVLCLARVADVAPEAFAAVLAEYAAKKVFCTIVNALMQANQLQGKIQFYNRHFREIEVELGIPPAVRMIFLEGEGSIAARLVEGVAAELSAALADASAPADEATEMMESPPAPSEAASGPAAEVEPPQEQPVPESAEESPPDRDGKEPEAGPAVAAAPAAPEEAEEPPPAVKAPGDGLIRFRCSGCDRPYMVPAERAGLEARCKKCGTVFRVPSPS